MPFDTSLRATTFVWKAAGRPAPIETNGAPILPRATTDARCAHCGAAHARFLLDQAISDKFTTVRNASILWPHGGDRLCAGCVWAFKSLLCRTATCFARVADEHGPGGIWPVSLRPIARPPDWPSTKPWPYQRPDPLSVLLAPPPPPFVAWLPLYGINHGGEANAHRTYAPDGAGGVYHPADPLWKLQTKHTVPFAQVSHDARCYELAIDDLCVTVDVARWTRLRAVCEVLLAELRTGGVGAEDARRCLTTLRAPLGAPLTLAAPAVWRARVEPLRPHAGGRWWDIFIGMLDMPALTITRKDRT
jgi:hypothetical protein